jgi:hypothetical protein
LSLALVPDASLLSLVLPGVLVESVVESLAVCVEESVFSLALLCED